MRGLILFKLFFFKAPVLLKFILSCCIFCLAVHLLVFSTVFIFYIGTFLHYIFLIVIFPSSTPALWIWLVWATIVITGSCLLWEMDYKGTSLFHSWWKMRASTQIHGVSYVKAAVVCFALLPNTRKYRLKFSGCAAIKMKLKNACKK